METFATCALMKNTIVVASHSLNGDPCTAFFHLANHTWTSRAKDPRPSKAQHGFLAGIDNGTKTLYLGGQYDYGRDQNNIYEMTHPYHGWKSLEKAQVPFSLGPKRTFLAIEQPNDFCTK